MARPRAKQVIDVQQLLKVGNAVRYRGLGTGQVVRHEKRDFQGERTLFAVVFFPHRQMSVQVPVKDSTGEKLDAVDPTFNVRKQLIALRKDGRKLLRTWDEREQVGRRRLARGGPDEWLALLRDYATAARQGMSVTSSDADLVQEAADLLASELACAEKLTFDDALAVIKTAYAQASTARRAKRSAALATA